MKEWDLSGHKLCEYQAALFEESATRFSGSSPVFIRLFMFGKVAKAFDDGSILYSASGLDYSALSLPVANGKERGNGQMKYTRNELHWMGYLYRYYAYTRELSSREVYHLMPASKLVGLYLPLHTQDPEAALQSILASQSIPPVSDDINSRLKEAYRQAKKGGQ